MKSVPEMKREDIAKRFFDEYSKNGNNITQAMLTVCPELTPKSAYNKGYKILNSQKYRNTFRERMKKRDQASVLTVEQRREWLSAKILDPECDMKNRLGCLKELNRMDGIGKANNTINVGSFNNITVEEKKAIAEERINDILGIGNSDILETEITEHDEEN